MFENTQMKTQYAWAGATHGRAIRVEIGSVRSGRVARMFLDGKQVAESTGTFRLANLVSSVTRDGTAVPLVASFRYGSAFVNGAANKCRVTCGEVAVPLEVLEAPLISTWNPFARWSALILPLAGILAIEEFIPLLSSPGIRLIPPVLVAMLISNLQFRRPQSQRVQ